MQTIGSAGESVAAGAIFTLPALFLWAEEGTMEFPSMITIGLVALVGGVLGVVFMVPLRQALIVEEHGTLPFPEGTACAEVLLAGEEGGSKAGTVFAGLGLSAAYKFVADGLILFPSEVGYDIPAYKGSSVGMQVLPALAGVGYICGPQISSYMLAGGTLSWFVIMPMIALFGADAVVFPGTKAISSMAPSDLWGTYVKYIGAGAVATGGIISLIKNLPLIGRTFVQAMKGVNAKSSSTLRTEQDLPMVSLIIVMVVCALAIWLLPAFPVNLIGAITIGGIICVIAAIAGDCSQDLKTGFIVGATPKKQQIGEIIGVVASAAVIGFVLNLLNNAWGYGTDAIPAPQATMMKMLVEGIMNAQLPWALILTGVFVAIVVEILRIPVMPFAVGMYLPFSLSAGIMTGGVIRWFMERRKGVSEEEKRAGVDRGILYTSGLIAGEGLMGVILAILTVAGLADAINLKERFGISIGQIGSLVVFALLLATLVRVCTKPSKK